MRALIAALRKRIADWLIGSRTCRAPGCRRTALSRNSAFDPDGVVVDLCREHWESSRAEWRNYERHAYGKRRAMYGNRPVEPFAEWYGVVD